MYYLFSRSSKYTVSATITTLPILLWDRDKIKVCAQVKTKTSARWLTSYHWGQRGKKVKQ